MSRQVIADEELEELKPTPPSIPIINTRLSFDKNDTGNAWLLHSQAHDRLRFVEGTDGMEQDWLVYEHGVWGKNETEREGLYDAMLVARKAYTRRETDGPEQKACQKWAESSGNIGHRRACFEILKNLPGITVKPDDLDAVEDVVAAPNGRIDLHTGDLLTDEAPLELHTRVVGCKYNPQARHAGFENMIKLMFPDRKVRLFIQKIAGLGLIGHNREKVLTLLHDNNLGDTSKTTLIDILIKAGGEYATVASSSVLTARRYGGSEHSEDIAVLRGRRLVGVSENVTGGALTDGVVKSMTGGDKVSTRRVRGRTMVFTPQFTFLLGVNMLPNTSQGDQAVWNRLRPVKLTYRFARDNDFPRELEKNALPAVLRWMVEGAVRYYAEGLKTPVAVQDDSDEWRDDCDPLGGFISECCVRSSKAWTTSRGLIKAYRAWESSNGDGDDNRANWQKDVAPKLKSSGYKKVRRHGKEGWLGLTLKPTDSESDW